MGRDGFKLIFIEKNQHKMETNKIQKIKESIIRNKKSNTKNIFRDS